MTGDTEEDGKKAFAGKPLEVDVDKLLQPIWTSDDSTRNDEEADCLEKNWQFVKDFMKQVKTRGVENLSGRSLKILKTMKEAMIEFAVDVSQEPLRVNRKSTRDLHLTGAITKTSCSTERIKAKADDNSECRGKGRSFTKLEYDSTICTGSSSLEVTPKKERRKKLRRKNRVPFVFTDSSPSPGTVGKLLKQLDFRAVPPLESFNENTGQDLAQYLEKFEYFCQQNFRGKRYLWINELERHLTGRVLEALQSLHQFGDNYEEVREKLMLWYNDESEIRRARARKKFESARPKPKESLYIFSNRLETLYKIAYPRHNSDVSNTLIHQFKASVCKGMRSIINSQVLNYKLRGQRLKWKEVQKCARLFDLEKSMERTDERSSEEEDGQKEIVINVSQNAVRPPKPDEGQERPVNGRLSHTNQPSPPVPYQSMVFQNSARYRFPSDLKFLGILNIMSHFMQISLHVMFSLSGMATSNLQLLRITETMDRVLDLELLRQLRMLEHVIFVDVLVIFRHIAEFDYIHVLSVEDLDTLLVIVDMI